MFKKILVPVDLTNKNLQAIMTAARLAVAESGEVWLLHVVEELDAPFEEMREFYDRLEANANERLAEYARTAQEEGATVSTTVTFGKRAREIVDFANGHDIDLLILTSHQLDPSDLNASLMTISHQVALAAHPSVLLLR